MRARCGVILGEAHLVRARLFDNLQQMGKLGLDLDFLTLQLDDQNGRRALRIAGVDRRLGRLDGQPVHDLHRAGQQARGHHLGDRVARRAERAIGGQHRAIALRLGQQAQRDLQRDAKEPFRADEEAGQVGPHRLQAFPAQLDHLAVGQHRLDAQDVVGRHAVLQAVRAARVEGDIAADRADELAGRVGRVVEAVGRSRLGDVEVDHAGLDDGDALRPDRVLRCDSGG